MEATKVIKKAKKKAAVKEVEKKAKSSANVFFECVCKANIRGYSQGRKYECQEKDGVFSVFIDVVGRDGAKDFKKFSNFNKDIFGRYFE